jgi:predicted nucleotide-binding protein
LPEKWENLASDVDAAIAIATPDEKGGQRTEPPSDYRPRARQNVWLEVGWFWGRLGRDKIMLLRKGNVDLPSDLQGLEYHSYREAPPGDARDHVREFIRRIPPGA